MRGSPSSLHRKLGTLYFSEAMRHHLNNPAHGFIQFGSCISFVEAVTDGLYIGDSRGVWFLSGTDPTKFEMKLVQPTYVRCAAAA